MDDTSPCGGRLGEETVEDLVGRSGLSEDSSRHGVSRDETVGPSSGRVDPTRSVDSVGLSDGCESSSDVGLDGETTSLTVVEMTG